MTSMTGRGSRRASAWLAALATLAGTALRLPGLLTLPPPAWVDEIWFAVKAREFAQGAPLVAHFGYTPTAGGNTGLIYLTLLANLLGVQSIAAARFPVAIAGIISVPLAYAAVRAAVRDVPRRREIALAAAWITAFLPISLIASRVGMEPGLLPAALLFVVWQIALSWRGSVRAWVHWGAAGLAAGLAQYNGPHARLLLPLIAYLWLDGWLARRASKISNFKFQISNLTALGLAMLIVTLPLLMTFIQHPDYLTGRALSVAEGVSQPDNALRVIGAFNFAGDINARQNLPSAPMLDPILSVGFVAGLVWSVWNARRASARLLLAWLILMIIPSALTAEAPHFGRMIGAAVPAAALAAMGWVAIYHWLAERAENFSNFKFQISNLLAAGVGLMIIASLSWNTFQVFGLWANHPDLAEAFTAKSVRVGQELVRRAVAGEAVYVERRLETPDLLAFEYLFAGTAVRRVDFRECLPVTSPPATYLALTGDKSPISGQRVDLGWQGVYTLGGANAIPADDGLVVATFDPGIAVAIRSRSSAAGKVVIALSLSVSAPVGRDWSHFIHVQPSGVDGQPPLAQADGQPCGAIYPMTQWHNGEAIRINPVEIALPADLRPGSVDVVFGLYDPATGERAALLSADRPLPDNRAILFSFDVP